MGWRYTESAPDLSGLSASLTSVQQQTAKNASDIAAIQAQNNASQSNGKSYSVTFNTDTDRTSNFNTGLNGGLSVGSVPGLVCTINTATGQSQRSHIIFQQPLLTLDQSIVVVLGSDNNASGFYLFLGCLGDFTSSVYAYIQQGSAISFGTATYNTTTGAYTLNSPISTKTTGIPDQTSGKAVEFRRVQIGSDEQYSILIGGTTAFIYTDAGATINHGTPNVYTAYGCIGVRTAQAGQVNSPIITSISTSDLAIPVIKGTGWYFYRNTSATIGLGSGDVMFATGTLNTLLQNSNMLNPATTGAVTVSIAGWYLVELCCKFNGTGAYSAQLWTNLNTDGTVNSSNTMRLTRTAQDTGGANISCTWPIYCPVGTILRPGAHTPFATNIIGEVNGYVTYWTGTLTSIGG